MSQKYQLAQVLTNDWFFCVAWMYFVFMAWWMRNSTFNWIKHYENMTTHASNYKILSGCWFRVNFSYFNVTSIIISKNSSHRFNWLRRETVDVIFFSTNLISRCPGALHWSVDMFNCWMHSIIPLSGLIHSLLALFRCGELAHLRAPFQPVIVYGWVFVHYDVFLVCSNFVFGLFYGCVQSDLVMHRR